MNVLKTQKHMNELFRSDEANLQKSKWSLLLFLFLAPIFCLKRKSPFCFCGHADQREAWGCVKLQCVRFGIASPLARRGLRYLFMKAVRTCSYRRSKKKILPCGSIFFYLTARWTGLEYYIFSTRCRCAQLATASSPLLETCSSTTRS